MWAKWYQKPTTLDTDCKQKTNNFKLVHITHVLKTFSFLQIFRKYINIITLLLVAICLWPFTAEGEEYDKALLTLLQKAQNYSWKTQSIIYQSMTLFLRFLWLKFSVQLSFHWNAPFLKHYNTINYYITSFHNCESFISPPPKSLFLRLCGY
jgi:hypothetical protein